MEQKENAVPDSRQVQREAVRSTTDEHHHGGSSLEGMMAHISAEVTSTAQHKRALASTTIAERLGAAVVVCTRCQKEPVTGCAHGAMPDGTGCVNL